MYRALYRKWRPQRFEDVVAQRGIVTALRNQIASGRVGHAYLFTGVRGTGKTTCAKIFAKAVNCLHPHNGDPCGECEICKGIDNGSILDVVEMDAASNNGVDDIRDLRDETAYTPSACHYKVYIIDEVHMLSTAAFNALLKTLEEPPAHVIFILATTEIQKVPATILSRCQRYDFTRIGPEDIAQRVEYIAGQEGLELTTDGAELISRLADGAMRDALSILDTCAGVTAKIDADVVRRMAGVTDRSYLFHISDALEAQDGAAALAQLAALRQQSVDVKRLTEELIAHYRALMLAALPGGQSLLSGVSPEEEQQYLEKGPQLGQREAIRAICPHVKVGLTLSLHDLQAQPGGEPFAEAAWNEEFTHYLPYIQGDDFLGVQNYTRTLYGPTGQLPAPEGAELTQMDYEFYPQALEHVLRKVAKDFHGDLIVTENGIATADDTRRAAFIEQALAGVQRCVADGLPVKGYFHWSLMDNFEWQKGFAMNFGLIAVDRTTMARTPKPSLAVLGSYAGE